ncbi:hypothetical protein [Nocardia sp. XZ_19_385]|uniref:hypothetical protein n=1 Tax=Nocardia sp. XZ_19_385 TaxID=2769488 RepID=UPI00188FE91E|nr:hypothetical protein [Nocardia sp. XZ_19_385]
MSKDGKSKAERLVETEQWQAFRGEVDTWAFEEIDTRLRKLSLKVRSYDPPPDLESVDSDIDDVRGILYRRKERLRSYQRQATT